MESEVDGSPSMSAEITAPEERVSAYGWKALAGSVIGFSMDGFDMLILGFMLPTISADLGLTATQAGSLPPLKSSNSGAAEASPKYGSKPNHTKLISSWACSTAAGQPI